MCFLVCFIPFLARLLENDPKHLKLLLIGQGLMCHLDLLILHIPPHDIINSGGTVR